MVLLAFVAGAPSAPRHSGARPAAWPGSPCARHLVRCRSTGDYVLPGPFSRTAGRPEPGSVGPWICSSATSRSPFCTTRYKLPPREPAARSCSAGTSASARSRSSATSPTVQARSGWVPAIRWRCRGPHHSLHSDRRVARRCCPRRPKSVRPSRQEVSDQRHRNKGLEQMGAACCR